MVQQADEIVRALMEKSTRMDATARIVEILTEQNLLLGRIAAALEQLADPATEAPTPAQSGPAVNVPLA